MGGNEGGSLTPHDTITCARTPRHRPQNRTRAVTSEPKRIDIYCVYTHIYIEIGNRESDDDYGQSKPKEPICVIGTGFDRARVTETERCGDNRKKQVGKERNKKSHLFFSTASQK